jgi:hypothetical protein
LRSRLIQQELRGLYRTYLIGSNGHILRSVDVVCKNDAAAKEKAEQLVDGHDVELWQQERKVALFKHERK